MNRRSLLGLSVVVPFLARDTVSARTPDPYLNVRDFASPQAAIDAAPAGATVIFPRGIHRGDIVLNKTLRLTGEGTPALYRGGVSHVPDNVGAIVEGRLLVEPTADVPNIGPVIQNIGFDGGITMRSVDSPLRAVSGWVLDNVRSYRSAAHGIELAGHVFEGVMRNVYATRAAGDGCYIHKENEGIPGEIEMNGCRFFGNTGAGLKIWEGGNLTAGSISCSHNGEEGLVVAGAPFDAVTVNLENNGLKPGGSQRQAYFWNKGMRIGAIRMNITGDQDGAVIDRCLNGHIGTLTGNSTGTRKDLIILRDSGWMDVANYDAPDGVGRFVNDGFQCRVMMGQMVLG